VFVQDLVRHAALRYGDAPALSDGERTLSFVEFEERTARLGNALLGLGLQPGDRVASVLPNCIEELLAYVALSRTGLHRVGLNARDTAEDHRGAMEKASLRLVLELPKWPVPVRGDPTRLSQVMDNLLQNALKFTRPGTTVTLRVGASAERVLIEVQDECGGPPSGDVNELFRPFEQRSADRTGMGLGLAFSRWGAEVNEGRIYARNLPGRGCVFTVDLPRQPVPTVVVVQA